MRDSNHLHNTPRQEITSSFRPQKRFDILFSILFVGLALLAGWQLQVVTAVLGNFWVLGAIIIILAVFRITKLLIADVIFQWFRDMFLYVEVVKQDGNYLITRTLPKTGFRREIAMLFDCPWCAGMWVSLVVTYLWFAVPPTRLLFLMLAVAGVGAFLFLCSRYIQVSLENKAQ